MIDDLHEMIGWMEEGEGVVLSLWFMFNTSQSVADGVFVMRLCEQIA